MHCLASRGIAAIAALLLVLALWKPWMAVPARVIEGPGDAVKVEADRPKAALPFRATCLAFSLVMGVGHVWHRRTSDRKAMLGAAFLASQLFFPFAVMALEPKLSASANWLHIQHENLVWLGGDLHTNLEAGRSSWKEGVYLVDTPRQISVIRMPTSGLGAFQFGRLMNWFETLGYSNRFCQFVNRGWIAAVFGTTLLIMAECLPEGRLNQKRFVRACIAFSAAFGVGLACVVTPVMICCMQLDRCRNAAARGLYDEADRYLHSAGRALPALREDTFYVAQRGLLDFRRGRVQTPEGRLFRANLMERQGRYAQAMQEYQSLVADCPADLAARREALRAILRAAIHSLNGQKADQAIEWFEQVIREEPCNLKANYALQLAYLRTRRRVDLERMVRRLVAVYGYFQMPTKAIVLASSYENAMLAAYRDHDMEAAAAFLNKAKKP